MEVEYCFCDACGDAIAYDEDYDICSECGAGYCLGCRHSDLGTVDTQIGQYHGCTRCTLE